jgi:predicted anti-sigma-YlaC factor YlaD
MGETIRPLDCERARGDASALLDGELAELERIRVEGHLRGCASCRAYTRSLAFATARLRAARLEQPARRIDLPRLRARLAGLRVAVAAAAVMLAAASGSAVGVLRTSPGDPGVRASAAPAQLDSGFGDVRANRLAHALVRTLQRTHG